MFITKIFSVNIWKIVTVFCLTIIILTFAYYKKPSDEVIYSLGEYDNCVIYTEGEFQDYTDYAKYYYCSVDIEENPYFTRIQESDFSYINEHFDDFERWIEIFRGNDASREIVKNYDFNREIIDTDDFIYIDSEKHTWSDGDTSFVRYNIYFFDMQTLVLYYFHNNR